MSDPVIPQPPQGNPDLPLVSARPADVAAAARPVAVRSGVVPVVIVVIAAVVGISGLALAWRADQRVRTLEQELVLRQRDVQQQATEARMLSQQALDGLRESLAKVALLEARLSEVTVQRDQLDELIVSLSRSRDENMVVEIESALRVAQQQSLLSGSVEPLVAALRQAEDRLARHKQPRLESVRRAIARDLDRVRQVSVADVAGLLLKLDEAVRMLDELPLLSSLEPRRPPAGKAAPAEKRAMGSAAVPASGAAPAASPGAWPQWTSIAAIDGVAEKIWSEFRSLMRVRRIENPEAMLIAPEQAFFLRENLKLRLLNARLSLLSRQFDLAQRDLRTATESIDRYFDTTSRRTQLTLELLRQIAAQARQGSIPLPDDSLAALTAAGGR